MHTTLLNHAATNVLQNVFFRKLFKPYPAQKLDNFRFQTCKLECLLYLGHLKLVSLELFNFLKRYYVCNLRVVVFEKNFVACLEQIQLLSKQPELLENPPNRIVVGHSKNPALPLDPIVNCNEPHQVHEVVEVAIFKLILLHFRHV